MASEAIYKLQPHRTMHLRGFDRRGCTASFHHASNSGWTINGTWSDAADFVVLMLWDADNFFEHYTLRYLPDFDFSGIVLSFDLALSAVQNPLSPKFQSIAWGAISWISSGGASGTTPLSSFCTPSGHASASGSVTISVDTSTLTRFDRVTLWFQNTAADFVVPGKRSVAFNMFFHPSGDTVSLEIGGTTYSYVVGGGGETGATIAGNLAGLAAADPNCDVVAASNVLTVTPKLDTGAAVNVVATDNGPDVIWQAKTIPANLIAEALRDEINNLMSGLLPIPITATVSGATITITAGVAGVDGNVVHILGRSLNTSIVLSTEDLTLTGGIDPTNYHFSIPFSSIASGQIRQAWFTFAPSVLAARTDFPVNFTIQASNWSVSDPLSKRQLKVAGKGSVRVDSADSWVDYSGGWVIEPGFYSGGFARGSTSPGNTIKVEYHCQSTHDLWLGTSLYVDRATVSIKLDGVSLSPINCFLNTGAPVITRRKIAGSVAAGKHTVEITHATVGAFYFDFLEAAVLSDVPDPVVVYTDRSPATDYDTDHTYKLSPQRLVWILQRTGMTGDLDHYAGVFWWNKRRRSGGHFNDAVVEISGNWSNLSEVWLQFGGSFPEDPAGTALGRTVFPYEYDIDGSPHNLLIANALAARINETLIGVQAEVTGTDTTAYITIRSRSPIYDFTFFVFGRGTGQGSLSYTGSLRNGNEGIWEIDSAASPVLNPAFASWHSDFFSTLNAAGMTAVVAFSQELTNPPDNPPSSVWAQRFANGDAVLTATGFGTEGTGFVEGYVGNQVTMTGHGYINGNTVNIGVAGDASSGTFLISIDDADHFTLVARTGGGLSPITIGKSVNRNLQTIHCAFSPPVRDYYKQAHREMAALMNTAGLTPFLQFGEVLHWFFSNVGLNVGFASWTSPISIGTPTAHGLTTGMTVIVAGVKGNTAANGTHQITVTDSTHFLLDGTTGSGTYAGGGVVRSGSMALYDADQSSAALATLGRPLASFYTQDDDPSINSFADADFLRNRVRDYIAAIQAYVIAGSPSAKFELLYPTDVNWPDCYYTEDLPFPQGGRLNAYINLPTEYYVKSGSGLDRLKIECLSWGSFYRTVELAHGGIKFPFTSPMGWNQSDVIYLMPWFNGGCPYIRELAHTAEHRIPIVNFWAFDHLCLLSWPLPLGAPKRHVYIT